jgi:hypothetical protein
MLWRTERDGRDVCDSDRFCSAAVPGINGAAPESNFAPFLYRYDTGRRGKSSAPT